mmetsp:Transcript_7021/g.19138  ORF Transcript_7021/g.19138 Transcript_7021/m.19138 type:complete len:218 (+) Transcript_7021:897-1550(+)
MMRSCSHSAAASGAAHLSICPQSCCTSASGLQRRPVASSTASRPSISASSSGRSSPTARSAAAEAWTKLALPRGASAPAGASPRSSPGCGRSSGASWSGGCSTAMEDRACCWPAGFSASSSTAAAGPSCSPSCSAAPNAWFLASVKSLHSPSASAPLRASAMCSPFSAPSSFRSPAASPSPASRRMSTFCSRRSELSGPSCAEGCACALSFAPALAC